MFSKKKIVKKLHPDINPFINNEQLKLYYNAVDAYKRGDLKIIRLIFNLIEDMNIDNDYNSIEELIFYKESIKESIDKIDNDIKNIKNQFPYNIKELLINKEELKKRKREYDKQLNDYLNGINKGEEILKELLMEMENNNIWQA